MKLKIFLICLTIIFILLNCKNNNNLTNNNEKLIFYNIPNENVPKELNMTVFGIEPPFSIPNNEIKGIYYDDLVNIIYVINDIIPKNNIFIELIDPENFKYSKKISIKDKDYHLYINDPETDEKLTNPVIELPIYNNSYFNSGKWKLRVIYDNDKKNIIEGDINIQMKDLSLNIKNNLSPFEYNDIQDYNKNTDLYFYGNNQKKDKEIIFAFYLITDKFNEKNESILELQSYTKVKTDSKGKYFIKINTSKLAKGSYKIATGENKVTINLFDVYFTVK